MPTGEHHTTAASSSSLPPWRLHPALAATLTAVVPPARRPPMEDVAVPAPAPAPTLSSAAAGLTLIAAAVAGAMEEASLGAVPPPLRTPAGESGELADAGGGDASARVSPCSVASDCSSVASADFEGFTELGTALIAGPSLVFDDLTAATASVAVAEAAEPRAAGTTARSVFAMDCVPLWGIKSMCGRRPEMEDDAAVVARFFDVPLWMVDGLDRVSFRLPSHFFSVYDGHGGIQSCMEQITRQPHLPCLFQPHTRGVQEGGGKQLSATSCQASSGTTKIESIAHTIS